MTECKNCVHYLEKDRENFYCKLLETTYTENQDECEEFEEINEYESTAYECD